VLMRGVSLAEKSERVNEMAGRCVPRRAYWRRLSVMGMESSGSKADGSAASSSVTVLMAA